MNVSKIQIKPLERGSNSFLMENKKEKMRTSEKKKLKVRA